MSRPGDTGITCASAPPPTHRHVMYDTLTYSSLNIGGIDLTVNRFCHLLQGFSPLPHVLALQEFRRSQNKHEIDLRRDALYG